MNNSISIEFKCDNAAFFDEDENFNPEEVATILINIAKRIRNGETGRSIHDTNGNRVGEWNLEVADKDDSDEDEPQD